MRRSAHRGNQTRTVRLAALEHGDARKPVRRSEGEEKTVGRMRGGCVRSEGAFPAPRGDGENLAGVGDVPDEIGGFVEAADAELVALGPPDGNDLFDVRNGDGRVTCDRKRIPVDEQGNEFAVVAACP